MHGLIFFYIQKFAESLALGRTGQARLRTTVTVAGKTYLPSRGYPDEEAVALLANIAEAADRSLPDVLEDFGHFLAPHLLKVAGQHVDRAWRTLDVIEHTERVIHTMIRSTTPGAEPPVIQTVRLSPHELQLIYTSQRRLCRFATGIMRGLGDVFSEPVAVTEDACMLRGDPFCSFRVRIVAADTQDGCDGHAETAVLRSGPLASVGDAVDLVVATPPTTGDATDALPTRIGGHRIIALLGQGGMGRVYLARDEQLDREVAIKTLRPSRLDDGAARQRFLRESRAAAAVEHEHVVTIHQVGEEPLPGRPHGLPFVVMQRLSGRALHEVRGESGTLPVGEVLRIGREIASGLEAAHAVRLVHRDLKPANIMLEGPGRRVKIIDFGLAGGIDDAATRLTIDGTIIGTPAYLAPERIASGDVGSPRCDLFSLGVILYELLAGGLPFAGPSLIAMLAAIGGGRPRLLGEAAPHVPAEVADLVMRLIAHDPERRPADAAAVVAEITALERRLAE
jgi:tRNA A-37 threonylcarbamoyl transferase component Bud32/predicted hydrocarbon binding protein